MVAPRRIHECDDRGFRLHARFLNATTEIVITMLSSCTLAYTTGIAYPIVVLLKRISSRRQRESNLITGFLPSNLVFQALSR